MIHVHVFTPVKFINDLSSKGSLAVDKQDSALSGKLSRLSSNQDHLVFLTNLLISAVRLGMSIMRYYYASTAVSL